MEFMQITKLLLSKGASFAAYRLPGDDTVSFVVQKEGEVKREAFGCLDHAGGFAAAPFDSCRDGKLYLISPDIVFSAGDFHKVKNEIENIEKQSINFGKKNVETDKKSYLRQVEKTVSQIRSGELKKVVLSRYFSVAFNSVLTAELFKGLVNGYPSAFVYLLYIPREGLWTGATPEILLKKLDKRYVTMALAGTQSYSANLKWENKEIEEQGFVAAFIENVLKSVAVTEYEKLPSETVKAGKLAHLRTVFKIDAEALTGKTAKTVGLLHPTPAVGGLPQKEACDVIEKTEKHHRRLYTGFLGPWNLNGESSLFVNLRCAEIYSDSIGLYVGGGITAGSLPEKEWQETVDKSKTMLSVVKKLRTFAP